MSEKEQVRVSPSAIVGAVLLMASLFVVALGMGDPRPIRFVLLLVTLATYGLPAAGWLLAAAGYGAAWRWGVGGRVEFGWAASVALGVGTLALLDWLLGWAGGLNTATAWGVCAVGWVVIGSYSYSASGASGSRTRSFENEYEVRVRLKHVLLAAPALALLLAAACIAPGILWSSEFGGYDALEYHLQLPAEWERLGAIRGLEHNAYSYLPSLFEAAYTHLAVWSGEPWAWAQSAQLLHAAMAVLAAALIAQLVRGVTHSPAAGGLIAAIYLATPWTIVTGSLAYNEQAMMALGAAAMGMALSTPTHPKLHGLLIGLLCGFATLVKLTAAGMVALPVVAILLLGRDRWPRLLGFALASGCVVGLWMVRNYSWTGNPVFPMFPALLGDAHWTTEEATRWQNAHNPHASPLEILRLFLSTSHGVMHVQFAYVLFPIAIVGAIYGWRDTKLRRVTAAMLLTLILQAGFWAAFTHHQSRFLIPMLLPACVLIGIGLATDPWRRVAHVAGAVAVLTSTALSFDVYLRHADGYAPQFIDASETVASLVPPYATLNQLPPDARVYAEGFATPFYLKFQISYHTVWDRSPLGEALERGGPDAAAEWLRERGYTHVLIDWSMIDLWLSPNNYGYDSRVALPVLEELARQHFTPLPDQQPPAALVYRVNPH